METYFNLFEIQESLQPDISLLKKQFYNLSKQFHPDRLVNSDEDTKADALQKVTTINQAFKTLTNKDLLINYILHIKDIIKTDEKQQVPSKYLIEIMKLNEAVSDYEDDLANESLKQAAYNSLQEHLQNLESSFEQISKTYSFQPNNQENLALLKDYFFKRKYLLRIQERILKMSER